MVSIRAFLNAHFEFDVDMNANSIQELKSAWAPFFRPHLRGTRANFFLGGGVILRFGEI